ALTERWARPARLIGPASALVKRNPRFAQCINAAAKAWPARLRGREFWSSELRLLVFRDPLLRALLEAGPVCDLDLERFLTLARSVLLMDVQTATPMIDVDELAFWCAMAQQCFINEYIFALDGDETEHVE